MRLPRLRLREFLLVTLLISLLTASYSIRHKTWRREESGNQAFYAERARAYARGMEAQIDFARKRLAAVPAISEAEVSKYDVMILAEARDMRDLPRKGKNLVVVAAIENVFFFKLFNGEGKVLTTWMQVLPVPLDGFFRDLWPPRELTRVEKNQIVGAFSGLLEEGRAEYQASLKYTEDRKASELAQAERLDQLARRP
ncbi:hypothetical protein [Singulisphaera sp. PoT]|uniref:hypothetical protein n=1 Tax=Singulisphaera sp. PoT TaxID=3411797 RepID=UPI003BF55505